MRHRTIEQITNQIADAIASGTETFSMPWHSSGQDLATPLNAVSGKAYRGLNTLMLWTSAQKGGFASGEWAAIGAQVRKSEKGTPIFFWERRYPSFGERAENESQSQQRAFVAKSFTVFNANQVTGYVSIRRGPPCQDR